jgi:hypothetical protein
MIENQSERIIFPNKNQLKLQSDTQQKEPLIDPKFLHVLRVLY